jgi:hypothetical protein
MIFCSSISDKISVKKFISKISEIGLVYYHTGIKKLAAKDIVSFYPDLKTNGFWKLITKFN